MVRLPEVDKGKVNQGGAKRTACCLVLIMMSDDNDETLSRRMSKYRTTEDGRQWGLRQVGSLDKSRKEGTRVRVKWSGNGEWR